MSAEEPRSSSYNFTFAGGANNLYVFTTTQEIIYEVLFKPTPYLFGDDFPLADQIVELVIKIGYSPGELRAGSDALIGPTVAAIIGDFYRKSSLTITIFICDTADRRHAARWRKFNRWYDYFAPLDYVRIDDAFVDPARQLTYHCALIAKRNNPYLQDISRAFFTLMADFNEGK
jgi:hypothetical protein